MIKSYRQMRTAVIGAALALTFGFGYFSAHHGAPVSAQADEAIQSLKQQGAAFASVSEKASPAVVYVTVERDREVTMRDTRGGEIPLDQLPFGEEFRRFFPPGFEMPEMPRRERGQGSGFIISEDGYLVTNNHVVGGADKVTVHMHDGRQMIAEVVGTDPPSDIAVIKVDAKGLPYLPLGNSDALQVGEWVLAIGSPFGQTNSVTAGIVSAKGRTSMGILDGGYEDFIQTDAAINPGNSGGPLIDLDGRVVGLNTAIISRTGGYNGIGLAIPSNMVKWVHDQIRTDGKVTRGYLGVWIEDLDRDVAEGFGLDPNTSGVMINEVMDDSPAEKAGLHPGDIVVTLDGSPVSDSGDFRNRVSMIEPGKKVEVAVLRENGKRDIAVLIGELPEESGQMRAQSPRSEDTSPMNELGITVQELDADIAERLGYQGEQGLVITNVKPGSPAADKGIQRGTLILDVDQKPVKTLAEFREALEAVPSGKPVVLRIRQGEVTRYVGLRLEE